jgi:hypothetical protein
MLPQPRSALREPAYVATRAHSSVATDSDFGSGSRRAMRRKGRKNLAVDAKSIPPRRGWS